MRYRADAGILKESPMSGTPRNAAGEAANGATVHTVNPATGEHGKAYRLHTLDEAKSIAAHCAAAQKLWRKTPLAERSKLMHAAARMMRANKARYAALMTEEMGKTVTEGLAEIEKCASAAD
jgi:succinate-semialdehyde dehydrogenase/glutarate-semialdehyde dehydrogenase